MTTPMTDEQRRIKSYLTAQAAKLQPAAIVAKVRDAMAELEARGRRRPAGALHRAAGAGRVERRRGDGARGGVGRLLRRRHREHPRRSPAARARRGRRGSRDARARRRRSGAGRSPRDREALFERVRAASTGRPARPHDRARHVRRRSPGARRCSSCACTTSIMPASCRSPPRCRRRRGAHCPRRNVVGRLVGRAARQRGAGHPAYVLEGRLTGGWVGRCRWRPSAGRGVLRNGRSWHGLHDSRDSRRRSAAAPPRRADRRSV